MSGKVVLVDRLAVPPAGRRGEGGKEASFTKTLPVTWGVRFHKYSIGSLGHVSGWILGLAHYFEIGRGWKETSSMSLKTRRSLDHLYELKQNQLCTPRGQVKLPLEQPQ